MYGMLFRVFIKTYHKLITGLKLNFINKPLIKDNINKLIL